MADHDTHDHTGIPGISSGSVATDPIWDAAGDLAVGTGANTAARVAIGATNGMAVQRVSGAVAWALPPGFEFAYNAITTTATPSATTEATANTVVTASSVAFDGSTIVKIEFQAGDARPDAGAAGRQLVICLYDDTGGGAASLGQIGFLRTQAAQNSNYPIHCEVRITPSSATHTYSIRAFVSAGTGSIGAGALSGSGTACPAFIRITKV